MLRLKAYGSSICQKSQSYKGVKNVQNTAIQVKGLQKSYKQLHVLNGVDFEVKQGSIFALLGSNGRERQRLSKFSPRC